MDKHERYIKKVNSILRSIYYKKLDASCNSQYYNETNYARTLLVKMHKAFIESYGELPLNMFNANANYIDAPAVVKGIKTEKKAIAILSLDLLSSGELGETIFLSPYGPISQQDAGLSTEIKDYISNNFIPYNYYYTPLLEDDIHFSIRTDLPYDVRMIFGKELLSPQNRPGCLSCDNLISKEEGDYICCECDTGEPMFVIEDYFPNENYFKCKGEKYIRRLQLLSVSRRNMRFLTKVFLFCGVLDCLLIA